MYIRSFNDEKPTYVPALERWNQYKLLWVRYWNEFAGIYAERFQETYGRLDEEKVNEVKKLIRCGKFRNGFTRHTCPDCGTVLVVPFSCKSRLCLSCYRKKVFGWSIHLSNIMNPGLSHFHATFTLPGAVRETLFERGFKPDELIKEAANTYWRELRLSAGGKNKEWSAGITATVHVCGNGLNYNPHVHLIGTRELVNTKTGEINNAAFIQFRRIRFSWMNAACRLFRARGMLTEAEIAAVRESYTQGFHVHFKPITGAENEVLFRTAEYLASGYFHNSQILVVDHERRKLTFRYKSWVDVRTKEKSYSTVTMDIYEYMAKMLYFLPGKHQKMIRYYGIYSHGAGEKLKKIQDATWKAAIENSFNTDPEKCPDCGGMMIPSVTHGYQAEYESYWLIRRYVLSGGYFRPLKNGP